MLPVGQQVSLSGHFDVTVVLEAARPLAKGFECRVHLHQSTCDKPPCGETAGYCPGDPKERQHWPAPRAQGIEWNYADRCRFACIHGKDAVKFL